MDISGRIASGTMGDIYISRSRTLSLIFRIFLLALLVSCSTSEPAIQPSALSSSIPLPEPWTPTPEIGPTSTDDMLPLKPTETSTPNISEELGTKHSWWAVSLGGWDTIVIRFGLETNEGDLLFWGQQRNPGGDVYGDLVIRLSGDGREYSVQRISPSSARVLQAQRLSDDGMALSGFDEQKGFTFAGRVSDNRENSFYTNYVGQSSWLDRWFVRIAFDESPYAIGRVLFRGGRTGIQVIDTYATIAEDQFIAAGPLYGTTTGAAGGTFSVISGIWAIGINEQNQVEWKKAYEFQAIPKSYGAITNDGRIGLSWSPNYQTVSFVLIDRRGNVMFWKHYPTSSAIRGLSTSQDNGLILVGGPSDIMKLTAQGDTVWMKDLESDEAGTSSQFAFEAMNGDLILAMSSVQEGTVISRFKVEDSFPDCPLLALRNVEAKEIPRSVPANIGASIDAHPDIREWATMEQEVSLESLSINLEEICRYVLPGPAE
jgi:hypothetical protein